MARKTILSGATTVPTGGAEGVLHGPVCARARGYPPILREGQAAPVGKVSRVGRVQELLAWWSAQRMRVAADAATRWQSLCRERAVLQRQPKALPHID